MGEAFGSQIYLGKQRLPALANVCSCRPTVLTLEVNSVLNLIIVMEKSCDSKKINKIKEEEKKTYTTIQIILITSYADMPPKLCILHTWHKNDYQNNVCIPGAPLLIDQCTQPKTALIKLS